MVVPGFSDDSRTGRLSSERANGEHPVSAPRFFRASIQRDYTMIKWILILLIIAAVASLLGMPALAGAAATGARILIGIVLIIFLLVVLGLFAVT